MNVPPPPSKLWQDLGEMVKDTVGPMAILAIGAQKFAAATLGAALNAEKLRAALVASGGAEELRAQFQSLGDSAEQARGKVDMIARAAASGPFNMESLGQAVKNLQAVGGAGMATATTLKQVQDVAAATGAPVDATATAIANLNQQLSAGGDATQAAQQLASLGAISQATAQKVAQLAASGAPAADSLRVLGAELGKTTGASARLASTLVGLESQLASLQNANNIKIGDLFIEGEKAGKRAAIGFEKVRGAIDEVASGPIAAIVGGFQRLKEAIAGLASSEGGISVIKGLFQFLGTAAQAILLAVTIQALMFAKTLILVAAAAAKKVAALTGLASAGGKYMAWINTATGRMSLLATAIGLVAVKMYESVAAINASTAAMEELSRASAKTMGEVTQKQLTIETPEDKNAALGFVDNAISSNDDALDKAKSERDAAAQDYGNKRFSAVNPLTWFGVGDALGGGYSGEAAAAAKLSEKENAVNVLSSQGSMLRQRRAVISRTKVGMDQEQLERTEAADSFQGRVRKQAMERLQGLSSPDKAVELVGQELSDARGKRVNAQAASRASFKENDDLFRAQQEITNARSALNAPAPEGETAGQGAERSKAGGEKLQKAFEALQNLKPVSESGRLSKDLALRENLRDERAASVMSQSTGTGDRGSSLPGINARIDALGGMDAISPEAIQGLRVKRDRAKEGEDPVKAAEYEAELEARMQAAKEAKAAADGEIKAAKERLAVESKIAALKGGGKDAAKKAVGIDYNNEVETIDKREAALETKDAASAAYQSAVTAADKAKLGDDPKNDSAAQAQVRLTLEDAKREWQDVQAAAAAAGVQAGDTVEGYDLARKNAEQKRRDRDQEIEEQSSSQMGQLGRNRDEARRARTGRDDSAGERAAGAASGTLSRILDIARAEQAAKEYKAAEKNNDTAGMNAAKVKQAATGFGGMGLDEIAQIKAAEEQILALKLQQAQVDMAAAAGRKQAAMEEVKFQQARNQLTASEALGRPGATTALDVERGELESKKSKAEVATPMAQEKEGLTVQAEYLNTQAKAMRAAGNEVGASALESQAEALIAKRDELEAALARLGFKGQSSDDIEAERESINSQLETNKVNRLAAKQDVTEGQQIQVAKIQEEYAPTKEAYDSAVKNRKGLEDDQAYKESYDKYTKAGFEGGEGGEADRLAKNDTKMNRLAADLNEEGKVQVDDLTRVGGNAAKTGLLPTSAGDKQDQLRAIAQEQADTLKQIKETNERALYLVQAEERKGK